MTINYIVPNSPANDAGQKSSTKLQPRQHILEEHLVGPGFFAQDQGARGDVKRRIGRGGLCVLCARWLSGIAEGYSSLLSNSGRPPQIGTEREIA